MDESSIMLLDGAEKDGGNEMKVMYDEDMLKYAEKRVKGKKEFVAHAVVYVIVNAALLTFFMVIGMVTNAGSVMFIPSVATLLGWGIGLAIHFFQAYANCFSKPSPIEVRQEYARLMGEDILLEAPEPLKTTDELRSN